MRSLAILALAASLGAGAPAGFPTHEGVSARPYTDIEVQQVAGRLQAGTSEPEAIGELLRLQELETEANDLPALRDAYLRAAWARRGSGELRAYARWRIAHVEWRRGRRPKAARWIRTLGFVQQVALIGPFPSVLEGETNAIRQSLDEGRELDLSAKVPGRWPETPWRTLSDIAPLGHFDLGALIEPAAESTVYVRAVIASEERQAAVLRLGTSGPTRLWLRGALVYESEAEHPARFDQLAVPVVLGEGKNELVLELTGTDASLGLFLRVTEADGDRLSGVRVLDPFLPGRMGPAPEVEEHVGGRRGRRAARNGKSGKKGRNGKVEPVFPPRPITLESALEEELAAAPENAEAWLALALLRSARPLERGPEAAGVPELRTALSHVPSETPRLAAEIHRRLARFSDDTNDALAHLGAARELDPDDPRVGLAEARARLDLGRDREAVEHLRTLVERTPHFLEGQLLLASTEGRLGFPQAEEARLAAAYERWPRARLSLMARARWLRAEGRIDEALTAFRVAASLYPGDDRVSSALISTLLQRGNLEDALRVLEAQLGYEPGQPRGWVRLGDLLSANGRPSAAERAYARAIALCPTRARSWLRRLRHHLRNQDDAAARASLVRAAELAPQDTEVGELARLLGTAAHRFGQEYLVDTSTLGEVMAEAPEDESTWTLVMQDLVEVHPSGLASRLHQEVHLALDERGARALQTFSIPYTPQDQDLRIEAARLVRPDGTILEAQETADRSLSEPWYRLYYDTRARQLTFPRVRPGDRIELVWRLDDIAETNWMGDYFGDLVSFQGTTSIRYRRYLLITPEERAIHASRLGLPRLEQKEERDARGRIVRSWEAREVPRVQLEPGMPGWTEVAAHLHVSTYASWGEVATWWWGLVEEQLELTPELEELAAALVEEIPEEDLRARVAAVHRYVVRSTRYVGLEFGVHGFKPYRVDQVNRRRFGDCKDKASLMFSLLRSLGIDSRLVILRTSDLGALGEAPASLAAFNHAILYVPALDLWLDGTAEWAGLDELPLGDRGASVLVVDHRDPSASVFRRIPPARPEANLVEESLALTLEASGGAHLTGSLRSTGAHAPALRQSLQARDEREKLIEASWSRRHPGFKLEAVSFAGLDDLDEPVAMQLSGTIPRLARPDGAGLSFVWLGEDVGIVDKLASLPERRHPLVLGQPSTFRWRNTYRLPAGWGLATPRPPISLESEFGTFNEVWTRSPEGLRLEATFVLERDRIEPAEYPAFRRFLEAIDAARRAVIRVAPGAASGAEDEA
ncbi:MAG: DUF3857 domain-containing protein [Deltaproteobacteria bacterium]|nr:DUF3857 domain-containing protein [Deltaproteobacteria bacterium]